MGLGVLNGIRAAPATVSLAPIQSNFQGGVRNQQQNYFTLLYFTLLFPIKFLYVKYF